MSDVIKTGCAVGDMSQYRIGAQSECTGPFHRLQLQWEKRGGWRIKGENPVAALVCEGHLQVFKELGQRQEYEFHVVSDKVVKLSIARERET